MPRKPKLIKIDDSFDNVAKSLMMDMDKKEIKVINNGNLIKSPFAKYQGIIHLYNNNIDCYVSDIGKRLISLRATVKSLANVDGGKLGDYIGINPLKPYIDKDLILGELTELNIPGTQYKAKCLEARQFLSICKAYVNALSDGVLTTDRQKEIAIRCSILLSACADIGLEALIDEATGYQYERKEDEIQVKLRLYIAEELRVWEKTFPDALWEEFGRLTNWNTPLSMRPKWWGKLVIELIYDTLDPDVARYLRENKPPVGVHWHRQFTENYGVRQLVSRCYEIIGIAKTCNDINDLKVKVNQYYKKDTNQLVLPLDLYEKTIS